MTDFMDLDRFREMLAGLAEADDLKLTFGGVGDALAHPQFFDFVSAAKDAGVFGLHLATSGRWLDEAAVDRLAESELDAVSIRLWGDSAETWRQMTGRDDFDRVTATVERIIVRRKALGHSTPFVIPEMMKAIDTVGEVESFFDRWYGKADWPVIRGFNDYAGQVADRDVLHPQPGVRFPCMQLFRRLNVEVTGEARVCGQDFRGLRSAGNVFSMGVEAVWHGAELERMRAAHVAKDYGCFQLCAGCRHWYQL
jgi:hypothetical protein